MIGIYHISNLITYLGIAAAAVGMLFALKGSPDAAMLCLIAAGVCDLFDGVFARRFTRSVQQRAFGVQIDSLADVISFGALPVCLLYAAGLSQWYYLPLFVLYLFALLTRLGYFNVQMAETDTTRPIRHYRGLPVTYAAFALPLLWLLHYTALAAVSTILLAVGLLILALLFIADIPIPKPHGLAYVCFPLLALVCSGVIIWQM